MFGGLVVGLSRRVVFPERRRIEVVEEEVGAPGAGEILVRATRSLISTGTEGMALSGAFSPGTYWEKYVK